jgi:hypothetical protein
LGEGDKRKTPREQGVEEFFVCFEGEVHEGRRAKLEVKRARLKEPSKKFKGKSKKLGGAGREFVALLLC